jgi:hypothetical protein
VPALHAPFSTVSLAPADLLLAVGAAVSIVPVIEIAKTANRHGVWGLSG